MTRSLHLSVDACLWWLSLYFLTQAVCTLYYQVDHLIFSLALASRSCSRRNKPSDRNGTYLLLTVILLAHCRCAHHMIRSLFGLDILCLTKPWPVLISTWTLSSYGLARHSSSFPLMISYKNEELHLQLHPEHMECALLTSTPDAHIFHFYIAVSTTHRGNSTNHCLSVCPTNHTLSNFLYVLNKEEGREYWYYLHQSTNTIQCIAHTPSGHCYYSLIKNAAALGNPTNHCAVYLSSPTHTKYPTWCLEQRGGLGVPLHDVILLH